MDSNRFSRLFVLVAIAVVFGTPIARAERLEVPARSATGITVEGGTATGILLGLHVGDTASDIQRVVVLEFDLSFLPQDATVTAATLHAPVVRITGDPVGLGPLQAGVADTPHALSLDPQLEWGTDSLLGHATVSGTLAPDEWLTADLSDQVASRIEHGFGNDPGRIVVRLEFSNPTDGDSTMDSISLSPDAWLELDVSLPDPITGRPDHHLVRRIVPVVGSLQGSYGTRWVTEMALVNPSSYPAAVWLYFTPTGADGRTDFTVARVDLAAGEQRTWEDVLPDLFGLSGTKGWLEVATTVPDLHAWARVANVGGEGSYGQTVPLVSEATVFVPGTPLRFEHRTERRLGMLRIDSGDRTNIGFVNLGPDAVSVRVVAQSEHHTGYGSVDIPPSGHVQSALDSVVPEVAGDGPIQLRFYLLGGGSGSDPAEAGVIAYASRVDNTTGDAVFLLAR